MFATYYFGIHRIIPVLIFIFISMEIGAQQIPGTSTEDGTVQEVELPADPFGRHTPRGTVRGFLSAVADRDYNLASLYINIDPTLQNTQEGEQIAQALQRLLDQGDLFPYSRISNERAGFTNDDLQPGMDRVGTASVDGLGIGIIVEITEGPEGSPLWLFSSQTVQHLSLTQFEEELFIERILPDFLLDTQIRGAAIGQWLALIILAVLAYMMAWGITTVLKFILPKFWRQASTDPTAGVIKAMAFPVMIYLAGWFFVYLSQIIGISIVLRQRFSVLTIIIAVVAILLFLWRLVGVIGDISKKRMIRRGNASGMSVVLFLQRATRFTIVVLGIISILGLFGINVTAGLAALGIGGIALALGAQKTMENLVGSITLVADQPVRVGDFCKVGDIVGTVQSIGMRSTRIRTSTRTVVTIPNGDFSSQKIENFAYRDRFLFNPTINLRYETTQDQIRYLLVELRSILYSHPMVSPDPARIRFTKLGTDSIDLEVFSYVITSNSDVFLEVQEDLLLRMMDVVEKSGTGFAFPSQTIYFSRDAGISKEKTQMTEEKVRKWKEDNELQIPRFDPAKIKEIKNKIPYPPEGSVNRPKQN